MFTFDGRDEFFINPRATAIGNMGEDLVVKDLIHRQFYVFVPVTAHGPCDLIIMKGSQTLRLEVKTSMEGGNYNSGQRGRYDVMARVTLSTGRIRYKPAPESLILNFDAYIDRCSSCGGEQHRTTDLSRVQCPLSKHEDPR